MSKDKNNTIHEALELIEDIDKDEERIRLFEPTKDTKLEQDIKEWAKAHGYTGSNLKKFHNAVYSIYYGSNPNRYDNDLLSDAYDCLVSNNYLPNYHLYKKNTKKEPEKWEQTTLFKI